MNTITVGLNALRVSPYEGQPIGDNRPVVQELPPFDLRPTAQLLHNVATFIQGARAAIIQESWTFLQKWCEPPLLVGDEVYRLIGWDFLKSRYCEPLTDEWSNFIQSECQKPVGSITVRFHVSLENRRSTIDTLYTNLSGRFKLGSLTHIDVENAQFSTFSFESINYTFVTKATPFVFTHEAVQIRLTNPPTLIDHGIGHKWCKDVMLKQLRVIHGGPKLEKLLLRSLRSGYTCLEKITLPETCYDQNEIKCLQNALLLRSLNGVVEVKDPNTSFWHTCISLVQRNVLTFTELEAQLQLVAMACSMFKTDGSVDIFCSAPRGVPTYVFRCTTADAECIYQLPCTTLATTLHPAIEPIVNQLFSHLTSTRKESPVLTKAAQTWETTDLTVSLLRSIVLPDLFAKIVPDIPLEQTTLLRSVVRLACQAQGLHLNGESWLDFLLARNHPVGHLHLSRTKGNVKLKLSTIPMSSQDIALRMILQIETDPLCTKDHVHKWLKNDTGVIWNALVMSKEHPWLVTAAVYRPDHLEAAFTIPEVRDRILSAYIETDDPIFRDHLVQHVFSSETAKGSPDLWRKALVVPISKNQQPYVRTLFLAYKAVGGEVALRFLKLFQSSFDDELRTVLLQLMKMPLALDLVEWYLTLPETAALSYKFATYRQLEVLIDIAKHHPKLVKAEYVQELYKQHKGDEKLVKAITDAKLESLFKPYVDRNEIKCLQNALLLRSLNGVVEVKTPNTSFWHACVSLVQRNVLTFTELEAQLQLVAMACSMFKTDGPVDISCSAPKGVPTYVFRCTTGDAECTYQLPCTAPKATLHPAMEPIVSQLFTHLTGTRKESPALTKAAQTWETTDITVSLLRSTVLPDLFAEIVPNVPLQHTTLLRSVVRLACHAQGRHLNGESWLDYLLTWNHPVGHLHLSRTKGNVKLKLSTIPMSSQDIALRMILQVENDPLCTKDHVHKWLKGDTGVIWNALVTSKTHPWLVTAAVCRPDQLEAAFRNPEVRDRLLSAYIETDDPTFRSHLVQHVFRPETAKGSPDLWKKALDVPISKNQKPHVWNQSPAYKAVGGEVALRFLKLFQANFDDEKRALLFQWMKMPLALDLVEWYLTLPGTALLSYKFETYRQLEVLIDIAKHHPKLVKAEYVQELYKRHQGDEKLVKAIKDAKLESIFTPYVAEKKVKQLTTVKPAQQVRKAECGLEDEIRTLLKKGDPQKLVFKKLKNSPQATPELWKMAFTTFQENLCFEHIVDGILILPVCETMKEVWKLIFTNSQWLGDARALPVFDKLEEFKELFQKMPNSYRQALRPLIRNLKAHPTYIPLAYQWFELFPFDKEIALELIEFCTPEVVSRATSVVSKLLPSLGQKLDVLKPYCSHATADPAAESLLVTLATNPKAPAFAQNIRPQLLSSSNLDTLLKLFTYRFIDKNESDNQKLYYATYPRLVSLATECRDPDKVTHACAIDVHIPSNFEVIPRFRMKLRYMQFRGWNESSKALLIKSETSECTAYITHINSNRFYGFTGMNMPLGSLCPKGRGTQFTFIEDAIQTAIRFAGEHKDTPAYFDCMLNFAVQTVRNMYEEHPKVRMSFNPFELLMPLDNSERHYSIMMGLLRLAHRKGVLMDYKPLVAKLGKTWDEFLSEKPFTAVEESLRTATTETAAAQLTKVQQEMSEWQDLYFKEDFAERQKALVSLFQCWKKFPHVVSDQAVIISLSSVLLPNAHQIDSYESLRLYFDCLKSIHTTACQSGDAVFDSQERSIRNGIIRDFSPTGKIALDSLTRMIKDFKQLVKSGTYDTNVDRLKAQAKEIIALLNHPCHLPPLSLVELLQIFSEAIFCHEDLMELLLSTIVEYQKLEHVDMLYDVILNLFVADEMGIRENHIDSLLQMALILSKAKIAAHLLDKIISAHKAFDYTNRIEIFIDRSKRIMALLYSVQAHKHSWTTFVDAITAKPLDPELQAALLADWMGRLRCAKCTPEFFKTMQDYTLRAMINHGFIAQFIHLDIPEITILMKFIENWTAPKDLYQSYCTQLACIRAFTSLECELKKQESDE